MRTLKSQNLIHDQNYTLFPEGAIINETDSVEGTPVVREVYNDLLINMYALLKDRGIDLNNIEDNTANGYQIISALKLVVNDLVDKYKIIQKRPNDLFMAIDLSIIPDSTVFHVRLTDSLQQNQTYILTDNNGLLFNVLIKSFVAGGDDCILIFDGNQSSISSLNPNSIIKSNDDYFPVFGQPISQNNNSSKIWYFDNGILSNLDLEFFNLQVLINEHVGGVDTEIVDVIQIEDNFFILAFSKAEVIFKAYTFNMVIIQDIVFDGLSLSQNDIGVDDIYMYADDNMILFTNQGGNSLEDNLIAKYEFNKTTNTLKHLLDFEISNSFQKSSNIVNRNDYLYSLELDAIRVYRNDGAVVTKENYGALTAQIFKVGENYYITDGNNAKKIQL